MYDKYISERENLIEIKKDYGFIHYRIEDKCCLISDYFVLPEKRGARLGYDMADEVASIAIEKGCDYLTSVVDLESSGPEQSLVAIIKYGFKIIQVKDGRFIELYKKIGANHG